MAKAEIFRLPLIGFASRLTGQIPVKRGEGDRAALEKALAYLHEGKAVTIFPEGEVAEHAHMVEAHAGVAMLALRSGVPILPIAHTGTRRLFRQRGFWWPRVEVRIGVPYVPEVPAGMARKAVLKWVTEDLMLRIARMMPPPERGFYAELVEASAKASEQQAEQLTDV
jgi:1-acyl-sn-glycerol-3-phosphate acyltransferase